MYAYNRVKNFSNVTFIESNNSYIEWSEIIAIEWSKTLLYMHDIDNNLFGYVHDVNVGCG